MLESDGAPGSTENKLGLPGSGQPPSPPFGTLRNEKLAINFHHVNIIVMCLTKLMKDIKSNGFKIKTEQINIKN